MAAKDPIDVKRHRPVMLAEVLDALAPREGGIYVDGTFGAGGYSRAILEAAACRVYAIDRDPDAIAGGAALVAAFPGRLTLIEGRFGEMASLLAGYGIEFVDGVVLDVGVSSMQLDRAERGFSFSHDGPLDMRMGQAGTSAADLVNGLEPEQLTRIIGVLGEEARARSVAKAIARARTEAPILTTSALARIVERAVGPARAHLRTHPATKTFQALRIMVNRELDELAEAMSAAEAMLKPGGRLAVVAFHSLEDRIAKRFFAARAGMLPNQSRHSLGAQSPPPPSFSSLFKGHREAGEDEVRANPRARSAKLRAGLRTGAPPFRFDPISLGVPQIDERRR
jgi:16S rRNA (cytosine1402-N4)-methyltransferase